MTEDRNMALETLHQKSSLVHQKSSQEASLTSLFMRWTTKIVANFALTVLTEL